MNKELGLYLVQRLDNWGYDDYDQFVCAAESEEEARSLHPDGETWNTEYAIGGKWYGKDKATLADTYDPTDGGSWVNATNTDKLLVTKIGTTVFSKETEIILSSFNAG